MSKKELTVIRYFLFLGSVHKLWFFLKQFLISLLSNMHVQGKILILEHLGIELDLSKPRTKTNYVNNLTLKIRTSKNSLSVGLAKCRGHRNTKLCKNVRRKFWKKICWDSTVYFFLNNFGFYGFRIIANDQKGCKLWLQMKIKRLHQGHHIWKEN